MIEELPATQNLQNYGRRAETGTTWTPSGARVGLRAAGHHEEQVGAGQVFFIFLGSLILYFWDTWLSILGKHWVCPDGVNSRRRGNRAERGAPSARVSFPRDGRGRFRVEWRAVADAAPFGA